MAKENVKVISSKLNVKKLIDLLNVALAEEWIAYYQYWIGAQVAVGTMRKNVQDEFYEHAKEELQHADWITSRIIELNGIPVMNPKDWDKLAGCKFREPNNPDTVILLNQNLDAEDCAIARYQEIIEMTDGKDYVTCDLAKKILAEEEDHAQDLADYINDIDMSRKTYK